jgi:hypothetical protein
MVASHLRIDNGAAEANSKHIFASSESQLPSFLESAPLPFVGHCDPSGWCIVQDHKAKMDALKVANPDWKWSRCFEAAGGRWDTHCAYFL